MNRVRCLLACLLMLLPIELLRAEDDRISNWFGFERRDFKVDGRACLLIVPEKAADGRPWIWCTEFFGHEPQADLALALRRVSCWLRGCAKHVCAPVCLITWIGSMSTSRPAIRN